MRSIPATPDATPRRRSRRALGSAVAASILLVGVTACAGESDDAGVRTGGTEEAGDGGASGVGAVAGQFEATAAYLQESAEQSEAEGYRVEMLFSMTGEVDEGAEPILAGEIDGDAYHYVMDMGVMMDEMAEVMGGGVPPEMASLDMTMEMAGDLETFYLRAPMFADMGSALGPEAGGMAEMGDGWGYVDLTAMGDLLPGDLAEAMGTQGVDPRAIIDLIEGTDEVEDLGTSEARGDTVHGMSTEISMAEMLEASGQDPEALAQMGTQGAAAGDAASELYDTPTTIEIWIDDDGYLRRFEYGWDMADLAVAMGEDVDELQAIGFGDFTYVMDMYDYGTEVDFEPPADAVDITEAYAALAES